MNNRNTNPPILPGCDVLPPMNSSKGSHRPHKADQETEGKAKGALARRKTADRFAVLNVFVDFTLAGLNRNEIAVWLLLYRDTKGGTARTSQADLARRAGIAVRTVRYALRRLVAKGLLRVVRRGGIGRGPSTYHVRPLPPDG